MAKWSVLPPGGGKTLLSLLAGTATVADAIRVSAFAPVDWAIARDNTAYALRTVPYSVQSCGSKYFLAYALAAGRALDNAFEMDLGCLSRILSTPWYTKELNSMILAQHSIWYQRFIEGVKQNRIYFCLLLREARPSDQGQSMTFITANDLRADPGLFDLADYLVVYGRNFDQSGVPIGKPLNTASGAVDMKPIDINSITVLVNGKNLRNACQGMAMDLNPRVAFYEGTSFPIYQCEVIDELGVQSSVSFSDSTPVRPVTQFPNNVRYVSFNRTHMSDSQVSVLDRVDNNSGVTIANVNCYASLWILGIDRAIVDSCIGLPLAPPPLYSGSAGALEQGASPNFMLSMSSCELSRTILMYVPRSLNDPYTGLNFNLLGMTDGYLYGKYQEARSLDANLDEWERTLIDSYTGLNPMRKMFTAITEETRSWGNRKTRSLVYGYSSDINARVSVGGRYWTRCPSTLSINAIRDAGLRAGIAYDHTACCYAAHALRLVGTYYNTEIRLVQDQEVDVTGSYQWLNISKYTPDLIETLDLSESDKSQILGKINEQGGSKKGYHTSATTRSQESMLKEGLLVVQQKRKGGGL